MNGCRVDALHLGIGSLPLTLWSRSTHGHPVSVRTLYHHSGHTGDRAGDCAAPIYRLCTLHVVVTAAALGDREVPVREGHRGLRSVA